MEALLQNEVPNDDRAALMVSRPEAPPAAQAASLSAALSRRESWTAVGWLPMQLSVALPIPRFRVRDLLALNPGQTIATEWPNGDDLPLSIEDVQLAWIEMEVVEQDMAVRITRLL